MAEGGPFLKDKIRCMIRDTPADHQFVHVKALGFIVNAQEEVGFNFVVRKTLLFKRFMPEMLAKPFAFSDFLRNADMQMIPQSWLGI